MDGPVSPVMTRASNPWFQKRRRQWENAPRPKLKRLGPSLSDIKSGKRHEEDGLRQLGSNISPPKILASTIPAMMSQIEQDPAKPSPSAAKSQLSKLELGEYAMSSFSVTAKQSDAGLSSTGTTPIRGNSDKSPTPSSVIPIQANLFGKPSPTVVESAFKSNELEQIPPTLVEEKSDSASKADGQAITNVFENGVPKSSFSFSASPLTTLSFGQPAATSGDDKKTFALFGTQSAFGTTTKKDSGSGAKLSAEAKDAPIERESGTADTIVKGSISAAAAATESETPAKFSFGATEKKKDTAIGSFGTQPAQISTLFGKPAGSPTVSQKEMQNPFGANFGSTGQNTAPVQSSFSFPTQAATIPNIFGSFPKSAATPFTLASAATDTKSKPSIFSNLASQGSEKPSVLSELKKDSGAHKERLVEFYKKYNPSKVESADATLLKYKGKEEELFRKLRAKYEPVDHGYLEPSGTGPVCYMDFEQGRVTYQLFHDKVPFAAENFRALCTGEKGTIGGSRLHYKGSCVHRIVPNFCVQAGDFTVGDGTGGRSIYSPTLPHTDMWGNFKDEKPFVKHARKGLLSMANNGPDRNGSQWFVTLKALPSLDGKHVVFGEVIDGMDVIDAISQLATDEKQRPKNSKVEILDCGELLDFPTKTKTMPAATPSVFSSQVGVEKTGELKIKSNGLLKVDSEETVGTSNVDKSTVNPGGSSPPSKVDASALGDSKSQINFQPIDTDANRSKSTAESDLAAVKSQMQSRTSRESVSNHHASALEQVEGAPSGEAPLADATLLVVANESPVCTRAVSPDAEKGQSEASNASGRQSAGSNTSFSSDNSRPPPSVAPGGKTTPIRDGQEVVDSQLANAARALSALGNNDIKSLLEKLQTGDVGDLIARLREAEKRQKKLEKQLVQAGVAIAEDIDYGEALAKVESIAKRMNEIGRSDVEVADKAEQTKLREEYFKLEQEMERYNTALMVSEEYQAEQDRAEQEWEIRNEGPNLEAVKMLRRHMPVQIRHMSEAELCSTPSPNGKFLPKAIAMKFKRTNILQCLRLNPDDIERMHPSTLEGFRVTGLTLIERRALYHHLKPIGPKWEKNKAEKMTERKWTWYNMMKSNFKENLAIYERHVLQYGPAGNHPYATEDDPKAGCPFIGKQCPIKADKIIDYNHDYGFTEADEFEVSDVQKADPGAIAMQEANEIVRESKASERSGMLRNHYKGKLLQVSKASGCCEAMDESMDKMEFAIARWIKFILDKGDKSVEADHTKEVANFTGALNELKLAVLDFAQGSGMQTSGKEEVGGDSPDIRSSVECGLAEEVVECGQELFKFIKKRMKSVEATDTRVEKTIELLEKMLQNLHEKNVETLKNLDAKRPERSRKLKTADDIKRELEEKTKSEEEEAPAMEAPREGSGGGGRGGLLGEIAGRSRGSGRGGLLSEIAGQSGRGDRGGLLGDIVGCGRGLGGGGGGLLDRIAGEVATPTRIKQLSSPTETSPEKASSAAFVEKEYPIRKTAYSPGDAIDEPKEPHATASETTAKPKANQNENMKAAEKSDHCGRTEGCQASVRQQRDKDGIKSAGLLAENAFDALDTGRAGTLRTIHFRSLLEELGEFFSPGELREQLALIDPTQSELIAKETFVSWYTKLSGFEEENKDLVTTNNEDSRPPTPEEVSNPGNESDCKVERSESTSAPFVFGSDRAGNSKGTFAWSNTPSSVQQPDGTPFRFGSSQEQPQFRFGSDETSLSFDVPASNTASFHVRKPQPHDVAEPGAANLAAVAMDMGFVPSDTYGLVHGSFTDTSVGESDESYETATDDSFETDEEAQFYSDYQKAVEYARDCFQELVEEGDDTSVPISKLGELLELIDHPTENEEDLDRILSTLGEGEAIFIDDFTDWYTETLLANTRVEVDDEEATQGLDSHTQEQEAVPPTLLPTGKGSPEFGTQSVTNQGSVFQFNPDSNEMPDNHATNTFFFGMKNGAPSADSSSPLPEIKKDPTKALKVRSSPEATATQNENETGSKASPKPKSRPATDIPSFSPGPPHRDVAADPGPAFVFGSNTSSNFHQFGAGLPYRFGAPNFEVGTGSEDRASDEEHPFGDTSKPGSFSFRSSENAGKGGFQFECRSENRPFTFGPAKSSFSSAMPANVVQHDEDYQNVGVMLVPDSASSSADECVEDDELGVVAIDSMSSLTSRNDILNPIVDPLGYQIAAKVGISLDSIKNVSGANNPAGMIMLKSVTSQPRRQQNMSSDPLRVSDLPAPAEKLGIDPMVIPICQALAQGDPNNKRPLAIPGHKGVGKVQHLIANFESYAWTCD